MNEISKIFSNSRKLYDRKDYLPAFELLLTSGIINFISFAQKEDRKTNKINWFSQPESGKVFWQEFILIPAIFKKICESDAIDQLLYNYFSRGNISSVEFDRQLAEKYPETLIEAIRLNQAFLLPDRLIGLLSLPFEKKYCPHLKVWDFIAKTESTLWTEVRSAAGNCETLTINEILIDCIIYLEELRFGNSNHLAIYHLANIYGFYIELMHKLFPEKFSDIINLNELNTYLWDRITRRTPLDQPETKTSVCILLDAIGKWVSFRDEVISPYCFDLTIQPVNDYELYVLSSAPSDYYKWRLNGIRYEVNQMLYRRRGFEFVDFKEHKSELNIPGQNETEIENNRELAISKWATLFLMSDLGIEYFQFGSSKINPNDLLAPLLAFSRNRYSRYELGLLKFNQDSLNWCESYRKLLLSSLKVNLQNAPFFLMTEEEYMNINKKAILHSTADGSNEIVKLFQWSYTKKADFNRFRVRYNVWQTPFIRVGQYMFCPMLFFANNDWFYTFAQTGLTYRYQPNRKETRAIEFYLAKLFELKGWRVKLTNDIEATQLMGDVDVFVEEGETVLLIQLKRTYFRLDLKDAYFESVNSDRKAAQQLNDAECYLSRPNPVFDLKYKPIKWIVSTSFENVGDVINGCKKISYFELLSILKGIGPSSLNDLINILETDRFVKQLAFANGSTMKYDGLQLPISNLLGDISEFKPENYRQSLFSTDIHVTEAYNKMYNEAMELYKNKTYHESLKIYYKCLLVKPNDGELLFNIANVFASLRRYDEALIYFSQANESLPNDPCIIRDYALTFFEAGRNYEGLKMALKLFQMYPLYGERSGFFTAHFEMCLKRNLLKPHQVIEISGLWSASM